MPTLGRDFVTQVESIMVRSVGQIVGKSLVNNQLKKLQKDSDALSRDDCNILSRNIVGALALFVSHQEAEAAKSQLDRLVRQYC